MRGDVVDHHADGWLHTTGAASVALVMATRVREPECGGPEDAPSAGANPPEQSVVANEVTDSDERSSVAKR